MSSLARQRKGFVGGGSGVTGDRKPVDSTILVPICFIFMKVTCWCLYIVTIYIVLVVSQNWLWCYSITDRNLLDIVEVKNYLWVFCEPWPVAYEPWPLTRYDPKLATREKQLTTRDPPFATVGCGLRSTTRYPPQKPATRERLPQPVIRQSSQLPVTRDPWPAPVAYDPGPANSDQPPVTRTKNKNYLRPSDMKIKENFARDGGLIR